MPTPTIIGIVVAVVVALALLSLLTRQIMTRRHLRQRFGPEYERTVETQEDRRAAERDLAEREKRHDRLELHAIPPTVRDSYTRRWIHVQEEFVDHPSDAITDADRLLTELMAERGYPTEGFEQQLSDLSVEHAGTIDEYRQAHAISLRSREGEASTEDLRSAMVHYRAVFEDLLEQGARGDGPRGR